MKMERIEHGGLLWAIILRCGDVSPGVHFVTPQQNVLQVGKQWRAKGTMINAHAHCAVAIKDHNSFLQEVLHIERGKLKVTFYTENGKRINDCVLKTGDTILLIQGGHGFEVLEDTQMLEVKMGPYQPESKKNILTQEESL